MNARGLFAALRAVVWFGGIALMACSAGCIASPDGSQEEEGAQEEEPKVEVEEPLALTVDTLDVVHGSLRVIATMVDGAADVSVRLGGDCEHREVGGGISTPSTLVWAFGEGDIADALSCGLVVRARTHDGYGFVSKVATLDVTAATTGIDGTAADAQDSPAEGTTNADGAPAIQAATAAEDGIHLVFAPLARGARLTTGDSVLDATRSEPDDDAPTADGAAEFTVPRIDFARSVLQNRPLYVDGTPFATSLSVGGMALDGSTVATDGAEEGAEQEESEVGVPALTDEAIARE